MSNPKRYKVETLNCCFDADMVESEDGEYVMHSDYDLLAAENEVNQKIAWECEAVHDNLKAERDRLAAENERLRKAGDAMADILEYKPNQVVWHQENDVAVRAWDAAKEGSDAK